MKIYRARLLLPISGPPVGNAAVAVAGGRVAYAGPADGAPGGDCEDLGDVILLPGLINAHCHLDYTALRGAILRSTGFSQWVRRLNELKRTQSDDDYLAAIAAGFAELQRNGTTCVLNIESFPELMVRMPSPPIRTWWFYELLDIRSRIHTEDVVAGALAFFEKRANWLGGFGLSPHAPYTTSLELYDLARTCCEKTGMPFTTHVAETVEEFDMFTRGEGPLYDFLGPLGRDMSDTGAGTPFMHLAGRLPRGALLAHMNVLAESDWETISSRAGDFSVVHCPNCHEYFDRPPFPLERFSAAGVNVCLGTDSLASNRCLNLFDEMRTLSDRHLSVTPGAALDMVTRNAALALGRPGRLGEITPGAHADLITIPYTGPESGAAAAVIANTLPTDWMLVAGQRV